MASLINRQRSGGGVLKEDILKIYPDVPPVLLLRISHSLWCRNHIAGYYATHSGFVSLSDN